MVNQSDLEKYIGTKPPLSSIKKMDNPKLIKLIAKQKELTTKYNSIKKPKQKKLIYDEIIKLDYLIMKLKESSNK